MNEIREIRTTVCSTMHCYNQAEIRYVWVNWWTVVEEPAPFCDECRKRNKKQEKK